MSDQYYTNTHFSGVKTEYETGATRDNAEGKGRYDIVPPFFLLRLARLARKHGGILPSNPMNYALWHFNLHRLGDTQDDHLMETVWGLSAVIQNEQNTDGSQHPWPPRDVALSSAENEEARYDLIPAYMLDRLAKVYERGSKNHGDNNWTKGIPFSRLTDSAFRHMNQWLEGDRREDHLAQAIWNIAARIHFEEAGRTEELDNIEKVFMLPQAADSASPDQLPLGHQTSFPAPSRSVVLYIIGPVSKTPENPSIDKNIQEAAAAARKWWEEGYTIICPHTNFPVVTSKEEYNAIMESCYELLRRSDAVVAMGKWHESNGSKLEHDLAQRLGKPIIYQSA